MLRISAAVTRIAEHHKKQVARLQLRSEKELASLSPAFQESVQVLLRNLEGKGWIPVVYYGERTQEEQADKVKAGYSKTMNSFHVADTVLHKGRNGLYWQVRGEAADIVDARYLWEGPAASLDYAFWTDLGAFAKAIGLQWGGDWTKFRDVAHVETKQSLFSQDIRGLQA